MQGIFGTYLPSGASPGDSDLIGSGVKSSIDMVCKFSQVILMGRNVSDLEKKTHLIFFSAAAGHLISEAKLSKEPIRLGKEVLEE